MGYDEDYLEELLKSIEPIVNPDGVAPEGTDPEEIPDMPEEELDSLVAEPEEFVPEEDTADNDVVEYTLAEEVTETVEEVAEEVPVVAEEAPVVQESVVEPEPVAEAEPVADATAETSEGAGINPLDLLDYDPDDGGKILSPDEITAMFNTVNAAVEANEKVADTTEEVDGSEVVEIDMDGDIDIDALLNAKNADSEEAVEAVDGDISLESILAESGEEIEEVGGDSPVDAELSMSADEIDAMLNAAKESAEGDVGAEASGDDELLSLLADVGDADLSDIQNLLDSDESGDAVAAAALDAVNNVEDVAATVLDTEEDAKAKKKREKKEAKEAKKKNKKGSKAEADKPGDSEPKKNIFVRIIEALTEPIDEDEFGIGDAEIIKTDETIASEEGMSGISDENKEILEELDKEKGKKKSKKKKGKKGKEKEAPAEGEEGEEGAPAEPKKKKKPKKEKKPKVETVDQYQKPEKKLPKKKVIVTFLFCFTMLAAILLAVYTLTSANLLKDARWAYDNQDYETAYSDLYGLELSESDEAIFNKSQVILQMEHKYKSYQNYSRLGMNYEAVDALLEAVKLYPVLRETAASYGVEAQVDYTYSLITSALGGYGVSEAEANEIIGYTSKVKYTQRVRSIADGTPFTYDEDIAAEEAAANGGSTPTVENTQTVDDILPEENDFLPEDPNSVFDEPAEIEVQ